MKLEKAIEIKTAWRKENYPPPLADEMNADALSIEALKRLQWLRSRQVIFCDRPLEGETE